jgi:toxin ParE1/3/4
MGKFRLADAARRDLEDIWHYIASDNPSAAGSFVTLLVEKFQLLAREPNIGRDRAEIHIGLKSLPVKKYVIFYRVADSMVEIARVISGYRDITKILH